MDAAAPDTDTRTSSEESVGARPNDTAAIEASVDEFIGKTKHRFSLLVEVLRFGLFVIYALLGVVAFWLWFLSSVLLVARLALKAVLTPLLWLADGPPRGPKGVKRGVATAVVSETTLRWQRREILYEELSRPLARGFIEARRVTHRFWHFSLPRKALIAVVGFFLVIVPGMYVVPRPNYVQVIDDNALNHSENGTKVEYLIHAVDLFDGDKTREYRNENMWYFGKINAQGMKNRIQPGRYYKFWVVGLRWYVPTIFPNIIALQEVDKDGNVLEHESHFIAPATPPGR